MCLTLLFQLSPEMIQNVILFDSACSSILIDCKMDMPTSSSLIKAKSEQLPEKLTVGLKSPQGPSISRCSSSSSENGSGSCGTHSKKSSKHTVASSSSPGHSNRRNTHIRKAKSAQPGLDIGGVSGGAALSRASSASLGLSFSFTGFTVPPEEIADSKSFSDDDIPEDVEAGTSEPKFQTEPTLPIYLKAWMEMYLNDQHEICRKFLLAGIGQSRFSLVKGPF